MGAGEFQGGLRDPGLQRFSAPRRAGCRMGGGLLAEDSFLKVFKMRERHQKTAMREEMEKMKSMCTNGLITRVLGLGCREKAGVLIV